MINDRFWHEEGAALSFTHPLTQTWRQMLRPEMAILDFGCGYGRLTGALSAEGFTDLVGYDVSKTLLERAARENPGPRYTDDVQVLRDSRFDCVLAFGLFTSCPEDAAQQWIVQVMESCTRPGSMLLISDNFICDNPHYLSRYEERQLGIFGCFRSGEAIFRHHEREHFDALLNGWRKGKECLIASETLHGNPIVVRQLLFRKNSEESL